MPFLQVLNEEQHKRAVANEYDFDHPDAFDFDLVISTLKRLKEGKSVNVPIYNFATHSREKQMVYKLEFFFCVLSREQIVHFLKVVNI